MTLLVDIKNGEFQNVSTRLVDTTVVEDVVVSSSLTTRSTPIEFPTTESPPVPVQELHLCQTILFEEIDPETRIRYWDLFILLPNVIMLVFLVYKFNRTFIKLKILNSPTIITFYILVCINICTSLLRCLISMVMNASQDVGGKVDQIFWVLVRFFLLSMEISVPIFALFFGHLERRQSIKLVLFVTCSLALVYSICQGSLELIAPDEKFYIESKKFHLFAHGGMIFWFVTCSIFSLIYFLIFLLPWSPWGQWFNLPVKSSFYFYTFILCFMNLLQAIGSGLFYSSYIYGLCIIDATTYLYFTVFTPLVYWTFLSRYFSRNRAQMQFSYRTQLDDHDNVVTVDPPDTPAISNSSSPSLTFPQQLSISSVHTADFIYNESIDRGHLKPSASLSQLRHPVNDIRQIYRSQLNLLSNKSRTPHNSYN